MSFREDASLVGGELGAEGIDGVEAALVTDLVVEGDLEVETVDVLVEVEDVGLDGALAAGTDGRADSDVAHSLELTAKGLGLNGIDTVARQQFQGLVKLDVRRRETDRATETVARHNNSQQGIFIPKHGGGGRENSQRFGGSSSLIIGLLLSIKVTKNQRHTQYIRMVLRFFNIPPHPFRMPGIIREVMLSTHYRITKEDLF